MTEAWQVGVDIGGTFTDIVAVERKIGAHRTAKAKTVAGDPLASVEAALSTIGLSWPDVTELVQGTTLATNAIIEGKLAPVALICTEGFGDTLAIARQNRRDLYRLDLTPREAPLVPEENRLEAAERLGPAGEVQRRLDAASVNRIRAELDRSGAEAAAVVLLHSYINPIHELALAEALGKSGRHIALSHRLCPEAREYMRMSTTVLNAALMPIVARYMEDLRLRASKGTRIHLFHSAGGMASPEAAESQPLVLAMSGPAAGVAAASRVSAELGIDRAISFDMGGTTTDVCLIVDGKGQIVSERDLAGRTIRQPMVAVESIGAGGGSIARFSASSIRVGPDSAGSAPGPACYGSGGRQPTVTDANLILGFLNEQRLLGGTVKLSRARACEAMAPLARSAGTSVESAARGVIDVANASMLRALRRVTVEQGLDARGCTLIAYGGAGPIHAADLARELGIHRVVVPNHSSMFSAFGCLTADLSYSQQQTVRMSCEAWDTAKIAALRDTLYARLAARLSASGHDPAAVVSDEVACVRYTRQSYAVEVPYAAPIDRDRLETDFKARHRALYGFATDEPWEIESLRLRLSIPADAPMRMPASSGDATVSPLATAPCHFSRDGAVPTPRLERGHLAAGAKVAGPAVIEDDWSTVVVPPRASLAVDTHGHLHIELEPHP